MTQMNLRSDSEIAASVTSYLQNLLEELPSIAVRNQLPHTFLGMEVQVAGLGWFQLVGNSEGQLPPGPTTSDMWKPTTNPFERLAKARKPLPDVTIINDVRKVSIVFNNKPYHITHWTLSNNGEQLVINNDFDTCIYNSHNAAVNTETGIAVEQAWREYESRMSKAPRIGGL